MTTDAIRPGPLDALTCLAVRDRETSLASVQQCRRAIDDLVDALHALDPELRARHVPARTVSCRIRDLGLTFYGRLDENGVHELAMAELGDSGVTADVRLTLDSDELLALADGRDDFVHAWLRGRVQVAAGVRDLLRLRTLLGL